MSLDTIILLLVMLLMPLYSSWIIERRIKKYIPAGAKEKGEKLLSDLESIIKNAKIFFGVKEKCQKKKIKKK